MVFNPSWNDGGWEAHPWFGAVHPGFGMIAQDTTQNDINP